MYGQEAWFDRAHNVFVDWLVGAGLIGLMGYLAVWATTLFALWGKRYRPRWKTSERHVLTALLAAYFIHAIFVFDVLVSYWLMITVWAYVASRTVLLDKIIKHTKSKPPLDWKWGAVVGVVLVVTGASVTTYGAVIKQRRASRDLVQAVSFFPEQAGPSVNEHARSKLNFFRQVLLDRNMGTAEASEQFLIFSSRVNGLGQVDQKLKDEISAEAVKAAETQIKRAPLDSRAPYFLGSYYLKSNQPDKAVEYMEKAVVLSPKKQHLLMELSAAYLAQGNIEKAETKAVEAYNLAPQASELAEYYALILLQLKQTSQALDIINKMPLKVRQDLDNAFVGAFAAAGLDQEALELLQHKVVKDGTNIQLRFSLAAAYLKVGDRASAIKELEAAKKMNPAVTKQADKIISEIRSGRNPLQK
jgi:tetratricopeptide (TPR) repeat protein